MLNNPIVGNATLFGSPLLLASSVSIAGNSRQTGGGLAYGQSYLLIDAAVGSRLEAPRNDRGGSVWSQSMGDLAKRGAEGATQSYSTSAWGLAMGADNKFAENWIAGAALSWNQGWTGGVGVMSGDVNRVGSYQVTRYVGWSNGGWRAGGSVGVGFDRYDQKRALTLQSEIAKATYDGHHYELVVDGGRTYDLGVVNVELNASLKWLRADTDGYAEQGSDALDLKVGATVEA